LQINGVLTQRVDKIEFSVLVLLLISLACYLFLISDLLSLLELLIWVLTPVRLTEYFAFKFIVSARRLTKVFSLVGESFSLHSLNTPNQVIGSFRFEEVDEVTFKIFSDGVFLK
jgi:hypothetical protein